MPVPKRKRSRARRDKRFANKGMSYNPAIVCPQEGCTATVQRHSICRQCGYYKNKKVISTKADRAVGRTEKKAAQAAKAQVQSPVVDEAAPDKASE